MSLLAIIKLLTSKTSLYIIGAVVIFFAGYFYRGMRDDLKQARVITKQVIKYVEREKAVNERYNKIDIKDKKTKEDILSGRVSEHYH